MTLAFKGVEVPLSALEASLRTRKVEDHGGHYHKGVQSGRIAEAHGVMFLCPFCYLKANRTFAGVHGVICWFAGKVSDGVDPKPGRWQPTGEKLENMTFVPWSSPGANGEAIGHSHSVQLKGGCNAHFEVVDGKCINISGNE